jgi:hypothetical protein
MHLTRGVNSPMPLFGLQNHNWLDVRRPRILFFFVFLTIVTGTNPLSGSTWKGAKLRIGEAKPDFRER